MWPLTRPRGNVQIESGKRLAFGTRGQEVAPSALLSGPALSAAQNESGPPDEGRPAPGEPSYRALQLNRPGLLKPIDLDCLYPPPPNLNRGRAGPQECEA